MPVSLSRRRVLSLAAALSLGVAALAVLSPRGLSEYRRLANEAVRLKDQNAHLREENQQRREEIAALRTNRRFQEKVVREDLGYVRPGEKLVIVETSGVMQDEPRHTARR